MAGSYEYSTRVRPPAALSWIVPAVTGINAALLAMIAAPWAYQAIADHPVRDICGMGATAATGALVICAAQAWRSGLGDGGL